MSVNATNCKCTFVLALLLAVLPFELHAQAPESFSYQAVIRDGSGQILANQPAEVLIVLHSATIGNVVYQENHTITTSQFGLFTLEIGRGIPQIGSFNLLNWGSGSYFLQVEIETDSSVGYINLGTTQLLSVPYALYAKEAGSAPSVVYAGGTAIEVTGTYPNFTINNIAPDQTVTLTGTGATQVSGVYPNFNISSTDNDNQTLSITGNNLSISGGNSVTLPSGGGSGSITGVTAGTGLTGGGTTGNVTLDAQTTSPIWNAGQVHGRTIAGTAPFNGQVLKWNTNAQQWEPANDIGGGSGDNWGTQVVQSDATLTGDGTSTSPLQLAPQGAQPGQVLKWNGTTWVPAVDNNTTYTGGTGIQITGTTITNTGDTNPNDDITIGSPAGGDLSGTYPNPTVDGLQGRPVVANAPTNGQVLKWNGSAWAPATDQGKNYIAGQGIAINGDTIVNTVQQLTDLGDVNTAGAQPGQVLKWNGTTWVPAQDNTASGGAGAVSVTPRLTGDGSSGSPLDIAQQGATTGQVLKWNGTTWVPDNDQGQVYTAGTGISISGGVITNTGDTNPHDDITDTTQAGGDLSGTFNNLQIVAGAVGSTEIADGSIQAIDIAPGVIPTTLPPSGAAGGDLGGTYPNPGVTKLQGNPVGTTAPASGEVLKWDGTQWAPASDQNTTYNAGTGLQLSGTTFQARTTEPLWNANKLQGNDVGTTTPTSSQVLKWDGTQWAPAADDNTVYTAGTGIQISGTTITNTGDTNPFDDITDTTQAGGDLSGTFSNLQIVAGAIGSTEIADSSIQAIDIAPGVIPTTLPPSGAAGGDLGGTYPDPEVTKLQGNPVSTSAPASGEVLKWDGTQWAPDADDNTTYTAGTGISISGGVITNTGDTNPFDDITDTTQAGGDLSGTFSNLQIVAGAVGSSEIADASIQSVDIAPGVIPTTLPPSGAAGGDLGGNYPNPGVTKLQGNPVGTTAPASGQVLKWDGTAWIPSADETTTDTSHWEKSGNFVYLLSDSVGIGTSTPLAGLHVKDSLDVLFGATMSGGSGPRLMWIADKGAFRAGNAQGPSWDTDSIGFRSVAFGFNTKAIGSYTTALGFQSTARGSDATAMGNNTRASGSNSTAMGTNTTASGNYSTAMGLSTTASGIRSTAMGSNTTASGWYSTAMGDNTDAKSGFEIVIGRYNTAYTPNSTSSWWNLNDRLFTLGNGTSSTDRSDAMVVLKNGNTGIMVSNPEVGLHVRDSVDVLFGDTMSGGSGPRLMWIADKGAFRAGRVTNASWDMDSIGIQSVALGFNTKAKGQYSTAMGYSTTASGIRSTAMGSNTTASGNYSTAMGQNTTASGAWSTAMGSNTTASGNYSTAMGLNTTASGAWSTAMGQNTTASGSGSTAMGYSTTASGIRSTAMGLNTTASGWGSTAMGDYTTASHTQSTAMGDSTTASGFNSTAMGRNTTASGNQSTAMGSNTTASGIRSTAMGRNTTAKSADETVLGVYNTDYTPNSTIVWNTSDRLFTIGNGTSTSARSNAMVVLKDGKTGIGTSNPDMLLEVSGSGYQAVRVTSTNGNRASIEFERTGGGSDWRIMDSVGLLWFGQSSNDFASVTEVVRIAGGSFSPAFDNVVRLGNSGERYIQLYAINGTINTSDARDKESVADLSSGLAQVMQLRPVTYRWKDNQVDNKRTHIGFLAQDLLETIPEVVVTHEWREGPEGTEREWVEAEKLGVNYSELIPVLTKAIQEQQVIIEQLQERLEALEQQ